MSVQKVNVEQKLAQIKAMGGEKDKIDTPQEQFQLSVFYNEVNLNPQKYSYEDRKMVDKCMSETNIQLFEKQLKEITELYINSNKLDGRILDELKELVAKSENLHKMSQGEADEKILKLLNAITDDLEQMSNYIK